MSLFDKKEEVLNTELTQYGKKMLSMGKLNPVYYAFYDDDLIYDVNYANFSESHTGSRGRLKDSITFKPIYTFATKTSEDKQYFENELGNSSLLTNYAPAWNIRVLNNEFSVCNISPPSASMTITYSSRVKKESDSETDSEVASRTSTYSDGFFMEIKRNYILLDVREANEYEEVGKDKFELEFIMIEDGKETLLSYEEAQAFFDISSDNEISSFIACEKISDKGGIYTQLVPNCVNYNGDLIFGKDTSNKNVYDFDPDRGEIC